MTSRIRSLRLASNLGVVSALLLASACGGSSGGTQGPKGKVMTGPLVFATFQPYSGPDAAFGPEEESGCFPATYLINQAGGILGHQVNCVAVDTRGDAADAVPAARQMIATQPNLVGIIGPSSDEADSTVPLLNQAKIPMFLASGQASYDRSTYAYTWRSTPADDAGGYALAIWAHKQGYTRAAAVFGSDTGSQGTVPTLMASFPKMGGSFVDSEKIALDQASYRTEVAKVLAANPQVIFTEADPQTHATFFGELKQLNNGKLIPIICTSPCLQPSWWKAVSGAVGKQDLSTALTAIQFAGPDPQSAEAQTFKAALLASDAPAAYKTQWISDPFAMATYDMVNFMALAMTAADSTDPSIYNPFIITVTVAGSGKTVVHSYKEGKDALASGKQIQYIGVSGPAAFDQWHNSTGNFEGLTYDANGTVVPGALITPAEMAAAAK